MMRALQAIPALAWMLVAAASAGAESAEPAYPFNRAIRPILSDACFQCHGPDAAQRKAGLRLDDRAVAVERGALVPGDPDASEVMRRITSTDPNVMMPPPASNLSLTAGEKAKIGDWIEAGAPYQPHWAFIPIPEVAVPNVDDPAAWIRDPIDAFVSRRLQREGLSPAPEAHRETLLRRVTLALTGLPPTPEAHAEFLADDRPGAYERLVDRLLDSPAYGERMAYLWLDAARYADSYGYQNDKNSPVWPWRDWVLNAFNSNLPYDEFITEQLAGDLLPNPTQDQVLATAFNRLHRQTNEGGSIEEEFRLEYVADRAHTVGTAFLGMTLECARCHDHKFDPISQEEYYALSAFFANIDESGLYSHFTDAVPSPSLLLYEGDEKQRHAVLTGRISERESTLAALEASVDTRFAEWLSEAVPDVPNAPPIAQFDFETLSNATTPDSARDGQSAALKREPAQTPGIEGQAVAFSGESSVEISGVGRFERTQPFTLSVWVRPATHVPHTVVLHRTMAELDAGSRGYELLLRDGRPTFSLVHFWPGNAIRVQSTEPVPEGNWTHLAITYDGSSRASGVTLYIDGKRAALEIFRDNLFKTILYEDSPDGPPLILGARFRDVGFKDGAIDAFRVYDRVLASIEVEGLAHRSEPAPHVARAMAQRGTDPAVDAALREFYLLAVDSPHRNARAALEAARVAESGFVERVQEIMVMRELPEPRPTHVLARGAYDQKGDVVTPDTPEAIFPFPNDLPRDRLGLAQWLTDRRNPLTARVAVNRYWQMLFGRGLVSTQEDFGSQGQPPTHPDLLDHLAAAYMDSGWDTKALLRRIVLSATYRQASEPRPGVSQTDPANTLLARGPHFRLPAELVRDHALAASGLLVPKIGGPSVKPSQPPGLWKEVGSMTYEPGKAEDLYRRSLYTFWKRTAPPPAMLTFDATNREVCVVRRETTATPLQALVLLNDPQFVEAARKLAEQAALRHPDDIASRMATLFTALTSREPLADELAVLVAAYREQQALFAAAPDGAVAYTAVGESPVDTSLDPVELAATTALAQGVMNFEEFQFAP